MKRELDRTLAALADPTRRGAVDLLRKRPRRAGELANALNVTAPVMSRHLRRLRSNGLIEEHRIEEDARVRVYRLKRSRFITLQSWLNQVEAVWSDQLVSFKQHTERSRRQGLR